MQTLEEHGVPMELQKVADSLGLQDEERLEALRRRLRAMERDGQLVCNRNRQYCLVNKRDLIVGRVIGHSDGFGFLKPDDQIPFVDQAVLPVTVAHQLAVPFHGP